ncbi:MAG TPA: hypothetical protein VLS27_06060 [Gammaproteobacteria bacterium]|nr:hypothetical protein [Gammaproteobacteria bacterium]
MSGDGISPGPRQPHFAKTMTDSISQFVSHKPEHSAARPVEARSNCDEIGNQSKNIAGSLTTSGTVPTLNREYSIVHIF